MTTNEFIFYQYKPLDYNEIYSNNREILGQYRVLIFRPTFFRLIPKGLVKKSFFVWPFFSWFKIFSNKDYCILTIYDNEKLVHYSGIFPKYFRFPFMHSNDLQIGDTYTRDEYRGKGLATFAIRSIAEEMYAPGRDIWYIADEENYPSIRAAEKASFVKIGVGIRQNKFGLKLLGEYTILKKFC